MDWRLYVRQSFRMKADHSPIPGRNSKRVNPPNWGLQRIGTNRVRAKNAREGARACRPTPDSIWDEALRGEGVALRAHACRGGDVAVELLHLLPVLLHLPSDAMRILFQLHVTLAKT